MPTLLTYLMFFTLVGWDGTTTSSIWVYRFIVARGSRDLCWVQKEIKMSQLYNRKRLFIRQNSVGETIFYSSLKVVYCYSFFWLQILSGKYSFNLLLARLFFYFSMKRNFFVSKLIFLEMSNLTISIRVRLTSHYNQYFDK